MQPELIKTSELSDNDHKFMDDFLSDKPWYALYYENAVEELVKGNEYTKFYLDPNKKGVIIDLDFGEVNVVTPVGEIPEQLLEYVHQYKNSVEIHIENSNDTYLSKYFASRLRRVDPMHYLKLGEVSLTEGNQFTQLDRKHLEEVNLFFRQHYPETVFSAEMLDLPTIGYHEEGKLLSVIGTLMLSEKTGSCHIGNALTHPEFRGRGIGRSGISEIIQLLLNSGMGIFMTAIFDSNKPSLSLFKSCGFNTIEIRNVVYLNPI